MPLTRRQFNTAILGSASTLMLTGKVRGANDDIRIGVIGLGGKGNQHVNVFNKLKGVRVTAVCDPDQSRLDACIKRLKQPTAAYTDLRKLIEDKSVDAVVVATCNHWHALATIWACQAGKDVYVEKPVSYNLVEGKRMMQATKKYNRIVQSGTQRRSDPALKETFKQLRAGELGKIKHVRIIHYSLRNSIGRKPDGLKIPASVDYNLWLGPAEDIPMQRNNLQYDWHWVWNTGNGELGNNGPHYTDLARWATGIEHLPERVISVGGRFAWNDAGQTPNTHIVYYDCIPVPMIAEIRNLPTTTGKRASDHYRGLRSGIVVECEHGYYSGLDGGGLYDHDGKRIRQIKGDGGKDHQANFIHAVRSRKTADLNADITVGHASAALCHVGNTSHRLGNHKQNTKEYFNQQHKNNPLFADCYDRLQEHLNANSINTKSLTIGTALQVDPQTETYTGHLSQQANNLSSRTYRKEFQLPKLT